MELTFSDIVGTTSLYFALVSVLGTFFFFSLSQWLNDILGNMATWKQIKDTDPDKKEIQSRLSCYYQAKKSNSFVTGLAWFLISLFMIVIELNIFQFYYQANEVIREHLCKFIIKPSIYFLIIYFILSITFLIIGYIKSNQVVNEFRK